MSVGRLLDYITTPKRVFTATDPNNMTGTRSWRASTSLHLTKITVLLDWSKHTEHMDTRLLKLTPCNPRCLF